MSSLGKLTVWDGRWVSLTSACDLGSLLENIWARRHFHALSPHENDWDGSTQHGGNRFGQNESWPTSMLPKRFGQNWSLRSLHQSASNDNNIHGLNRRGPAGWIAQSGRAAQLSNSPPAPFGNRFCQNGSWPTSIWPKRFGQNGSLLSLHRLRRFHKINILTSSPKGAAPTVLLLSPLVG